MLPWTNRGVWQRGGAGRRDGQRRASGFFPVKHNRTAVCIAPLPPSPDAPPSPRRRRPRLAGRPPPAHLGFDARGCGIKPPTGIVP